MCLNFSVYFPFFSDLQLLFSFPPPFPLPSYLTSTSSDHIHIHFLNPHPPFPQPTSTIHNPISLSLTPPPLTSTSPTSIFPSTYNHSLHPHQLTTLTLFLKSHPLFHPPPFTPYNPTSSPQSHPLPTPSLSNATSTSHAPPNSSTSTAHTGTDQLRYPQRWRRRRWVTEAGVAAGTVGITMVVDTLGRAKCNPEPDAATTTTRGLKPPSTGRSTCSTTSDMCIAAW